MPCDTIRVRACVSIAFALTAGCSHAPPPSTIASPPPVATLRVRTAVVSPSVVAAGVVIPFLEIGVSSSLSEPITDVFVRPGMHVRRGDVLGRIDTGDLQAQKSAAQGIVAEDRARLAQTEYASDAALAQAHGGVDAALAALRQAQATLAGAERDGAREASLERQGYLAPEILDQQQTVVAADRQAVLSAQATLREARINATASGVGSPRGAQQAQIVAARDAIDSALASIVQVDRAIARATLVAPVDGVVESVNGNVGEYPAGRELFTIEQIDRVYAALPTSSRQSAMIRRGDAATVAPADNGTGERGVVDAVLDQIEPGTTNFVVRVLLDNRSERLRPGMAVRATIALAPVRGQEIPLAAFVDDERRAVFAVDDENVVRRVSVVAEAVAGSKAVVSGIASGTRVVSDALGSEVAAGDRLGR